MTIVGRNEENLKVTASKCSPETLIIVADVTKEADRKRIIQGTIEKFGKINVLVNNAGQGIFGEVAVYEEKNYDTLMDLNVKSVFYLTQLAIPHLLETQGNIVNVSSVAGLRAFGGASVYCMTKAAVDHFTRCLALELGPKNVRVNAINPAVIDTPFHQNAGMNDKAYQEFLEKGKKTHALGRVGNVSETSQAIAFLASDLATFTTGTCFPVDGGRGEMCPN